VLTLSYYLSALSAVAGVCTKLEVAHNSSPVWCKLTGVCGTEPLLNVQPPIKLPPVPISGHKYTNWPINLQHTPQQFGALLPGENVSWGSGTVDDRQQFPGPAAPTSRNSVPVFSHRSTYIPYY